MSDNKLNWISAFSDKTTGIKAVPQCLISGDVFGDGDNRILVASLDQKLICFEGSRTTHEITLPDMPSSIAVHYSGKSSEGLPLVAVGAGNCIYFYLNLRQFAKFSLQAPFRCQTEEELYEKYQKSEINLFEFQKDLSEAKSKNQSLCSQSLSLISADITIKSVFDRFKTIGETIATSDCVTALATIKHTALQEDKGTRLLVGTESCFLYMLDSQDQKIEKKWEIDAPASVIRCSGYMTGNSTIAIVSRDRSVRVIRNLSENYITIRCESLPIDISILGDYIYIGMMSKNVGVFDLAGKPVNTIPFDNHIISMSSISIVSRQIEQCCVATSDGLLSFIEKSSIVSDMKLPEGVSALYYGQVGREPDNLLTISHHGGLFLRTASRVPPKPTKKEALPPADPLPIPKKSKLFVVQSEYEKTHAKEMYDAWQNSLNYIYVLSANTYASIMESSVVSPLDDIKFSSKVAGMGPVFSLSITAVNSGQSIVTNVKVIPRYNKNLFAVSPPFVSLPPMIGGYQYTAMFTVQAIEKDGKTDNINVIAVSPAFSVPLCSTAVPIPVSQFPIQ